MTNPHQGIVNHIYLIDGDVDPPGYLTQLHAGVCYVLITCILFQPPNPDKLPINPTSMCQFHELPEYCTWLGIRDNTKQFPNQKYHCTRFLFPGYLTNTIGLWPTEIHRSSHPCVSFK